MRFRLLLASWLHVATARRPQPTTAVEQKTVTEGALNAYAIGEGFEGSASDWTGLCCVVRRRRGVNFLPERRRED